MNETYILLSNQIEKFTCLFEEESDPLKKNEFLFILAFLKEELHELSTSK